MRGVMIASSVLVSLIGLSTASVAGIHDVAHRFNEKVGIMAREGEDKETVTVTVTSFPESCSAPPGTSPVVPGSASTPVVIVPGTQSTTATYNVPSGGATITPGASPSSVRPTPAQPTGQTFPSGATPFIPIPISANGTAIIPVGSSGALGPTGSPVPTTVISTQSSTSTESETSTTESTTSETSTTTAPSTSSSIVPASPNTGSSDFNGVGMAVVIALIGSLALII